MNSSIRTVALHVGLLRPAGEVHQLIFLRDESRTVSTCPARPMHFSFALPRTRQSASVGLLKVRMLVSSTKPIAAVAPALSCGRRVEAKKRKRIGLTASPDPVFVCAQHEGRRSSGQERADVLLGCRRGVHD